MLAGLLAACSACWALTDGAKRRRPGGWVVYLAVGRTRKAQTNHTNKTKMNMYISEDKNAHTDGGRRGDGGGGRKAESIVWFEQTRKT